MLEIVGATDYADRPVKGYSTGMKQRLGIAAALLNDPPIIILDEPTHGLDASDIYEISQLIGALAHEFGKTVFLSSHLLVEVEQVCDYVAIMHQGRKLRDGAVSDLVTQQMQIQAVIAQPDTAQYALNPHFETSLTGNSLKIRATPDNVPHIVRILVEADVDILSITPIRQSLEDMFLTLTENISSNPDDPDATVTKRSTKELPRV